MRPPKTTMTKFERIPVYQEWIESTIEDIEYDPNHKRSFQGEDKVGPCVRFKFGVKGCQFAHRSNWMTFSYGEKANLYKKFILVLVDGAKPDIDMDLDQLKGMKIKTMWSENGEYDRLEMVKPDNAKVKFGKSEDEVSF